MALGYSYGAATAALSAAKRPAAYRAVALLDGWFHIDLRAIKACPSDEQLDFPAGAFGGFPAPALFLGSAQFAAMAGMADATRRLMAGAGGGAGADGRSAVLPGTVHGNFVDLHCWLPAGALRLVGAVGPADAHGAYAAVAGTVAAFFVDRTA